MIVACFSALSVDTRVTEALLTELCREAMEQADVEIWRENARTPQVADHFGRHRDPWLLDR
jgi:hypothetical protein